MTTFLEQRVAFRHTETVLLQLRGAILDDSVWCEDEDERVEEAAHEVEGEHRMLHIEKVGLSRLQSLEDDVIDKFKVTIQWDNQDGDWSGEPVHLLLENRGQASDLLR